MYTAEIWGNVKGGKGRLTSYFSVEDTSDVFGMINSILLQPPLNPNRVGHVMGAGKGIPGAFQKRPVQRALVSSAVA